MNQWRTGSGNNRTLNNSQSRDKQRTSLRLLSHQQRLLTKPVWSLLRYPLVWMQPPHFGGHQISRPRPPWRGGLHPLHLPQVGAVVYAEFPPLFLFTLKRTTWRLGCVGRRTWSQEEGRLFSVKWRARRRRRRLQCIMTLCSSRSSDSFLNWTVCSTRHKLWGENQPGERNEKLSLRSPKGRQTGVVFEVYFGLFRNMHMWNQTERNVNCKNKCAWCDPSNQTIGLTAPQTPASPTVTPHSLDL